MSTAPTDAALPAPLRRPAALAAVAAIVVFGALAAKYTGTSTAGGADLRIDGAVDTLGSANYRLLRRLMALGSPPVVVFLALATALACLILGRRRLAVLAVVGPGLTGLATTLLKPAIDRTLAGIPAYPSGHTGGATALGILAALVLISLLRPGRTLGLTLLVSGPVLAGGAVGAAMIAINAHYPTDTIGGFCAAVFIVLVSAVVIDRLAERRVAGEPDATAGPG